MSQKKSLPVFKFHLVVYFHHINLSQSQWSTSDGHCWRLFDSYLYHLQVSKSLLKLQMSHEWYSRGLASKHEMSNTMPAHEY